MAGQLNGSVITAFSVLNLFTPHRPIVTTQDVSRELEMNTVTAYRFLRSLEAAGAIVASQRGHYRLGLSLADLGERAVSADFIAAQVQPYLNALSDDLGETALATKYSRGRVEIVARALSSRPYAMHMPVGSVLEPHCTANGKLWLASLPPEELRRYLDNEKRASFTAQTITDASAIIKEVEEVNRRGYALCLREREVEISAVAVAVKTRSGSTVAGLSIFGPSWRFSDQYVQNAVGKLKSVASEISSHLYGVTPAQNAASR
ncbi:IclR family transcriptional regulator [Pelagibacterium sp.]|uniref:IclR family transcriptional regulator n=1 Tax=Pelagibacterium sp. TaxID=1967288 RepID=UPI003A8ED843